jgi:hypothetical protein
VPKRAPRQRIDPADWEKYATKGRQFLDTAELAREVGNWTSAGFLIVNGAISLADAVAIKLKSVKSSGDDHKEAVALLAEVASGIEGRKEALTHLERIIDEKNKVAYGGISYRRKDVEKLALHVERFRKFAEGILRS